MGRQIDPALLTRIIHDVVKAGDILDVGGSWEAYNGASHVLDIEPKPEGRGNVEWIQGDACRPKTWEQFEDNQFDFAVCSHVLEDVYDPFTIAEGLSRVAKAGYVEVPSAFAETLHFAKEFPYEFNGYIHHHWIVEQTDEENQRWVVTPKRPELLIPRLTELEGQVGDWKRLSFMGLFWCDEIELVFNHRPIQQTVEHFEMQHVKWDSDLYQRGYNPVSFQKRFKDKFGRS